MKRDTSHQNWSTETYDRNTRFVSDLGAPVVALLDPQPDERILDLGCGDGALTEKLIAAGAQVVGVDASESFVRSARERGVDARLGDAHALDLVQEFDAVFSNAALHWMLEPEKVIAGVARALRPEGRFVGEFGGFGNVAAVMSTMHAVGRAMGGDTSIAGPWFYPTPTQYAAMLKAGGFEVAQIGLHARPTPLPTGMRGWLETMRAPFFEQFGDREEEAYERVLAALAPSLRDHEGNWIADYTRLRFAAILSV